MLKSELAAKNEQLATQAAQIDTLQAELAAERKFSREQSAQLTVLAERAQQLHAGTIQQQLTDGGADPAEPDASPMDGETKKKGLFGRLFGR